MTNTLFAVDSLGQVRAQIAELRKEEAKIEASLKARGHGTYEGSYFRATVSEYEKASVSWKDIALKLNPSVQLVTAHTSYSKVVALNLTARITDKVAA
jgi:hypothetical protein